ncbi:beta-N-acetylhexosaminidase, partial [bacterium]|nr:beta-N-acetylhexosaminidase [bacterium]
MKFRLFADAVIISLIAVSAAFAAGPTAGGFLTPLRARGYSLIPAPQKVELGARDITVDCTWAVQSRVGTEDIAYRRLVEGAGELHGLSFEGTGSGKVILAVAAGTVKGAQDPALNEQGYILKIAPGEITVTGNAPAGLFYGVQSLLQLLRRGADSRLRLPECTISDWPALELRFVHWDTKHHQCRIETLKRLIDWHAFFKANAIAFEIEDKYEFPRHPVIGAPGAYTKAEMIELTRYAAERHIQLVPDIQAPSHMAYALKHKEFAHLRADGSNYQACMCDPEAIKLIFDLYQDMIDATPGVKYFLVSTDEVYYAGICDKCRKKRPYDEASRSQAWVDFAKQAHAFLNERGRRQISWVEYPLLARDIAQLPPDLINGVMGGDGEFLAQQKKIGLRQLAYSSTQGAEFLFPDLFPVKARGREAQGRLYEIARTVREGLAAGGDPMGSF